MLVKRKKKTIFQLDKLFQEDYESIRDEPRSGHRSISTTEEDIEKIRNKVTRNRHFTVREFTEDVGLPIC